MAANMEPVEGISLEQYAQGCAMLVKGMSKDDVIKYLAIDMPKWDRVDAEWKLRMKNDTSFTIVMKYSSAFSAPLPAAATAASGAPAEDTSGFNVASFPFEKYVEAMVAQDVLGKQGRDAQDVLKDFGLTVKQYSDVSAHWSGQLMTNMSLGMQMQTLMTQFKQKYENMQPKSNEDIQF